MQSRLAALLVAFGLAFLSACAAAPAPRPETAAAPAPARPTPAIGSFGFDLAGRDGAVKPGDDFAAHAGGAWSKANQIPEDRRRWGVFDMLRAQAERDVRALIEEISAKSHAPGSTEQKIGDFYAAFLDTAAIDKAGLAPAQPGLSAIAAAKTHADIARLIARPGLPVQGPFALFITLDEKNPDRYVVGMGHAGLGLGERDYYLKPDAEMAEIRAQYSAHIAKMLTLAGAPDASGAAKRILALETEIAKLHWARAKRRERELTYNVVTLPVLKRQAPAYPWEAALAEAGLAGQQEFVIAEWSAFPALAKLFGKTPIATWKAYLTYHYLSGSAAVLPTAFDDEDFAFYDRILNGQPAKRERWKRGVTAIDAALGEGIGRLYVARHFKPDAKAKMVELVENVRAAYTSRIEASPWMTPATKAAAKEKLATFRPKIGYPDTWRDYSALEIKRDDAFGNQTRVAIFQWRRDLARLGKPTDKEEWFLPPQTVNAYYNPVFNEIVFPAAILQPPFFDPAADPAVNYGAIGGVIGHEMGHGFDDQGAKSDARGVLRTWWAPADEAAFKKLGDALAQQYSQYEPLPGLKLNGRLTLGENIGDLGGLNVAHEAYMLSLKGAPAPVIEGVSGDQRFFYGWSQVWRTLYRDQALRNQVINGPHSPAQYRINGVVRNMDAWYTAFDVRPGDKLYLPPEQRVKIW